jgi:ElaB/YqjD/DUF883 family membrane-anchored ribosome-binding protein
MPTIMAKKELAETGGPENLLKKEYEKRVDEVRGVAENLKEEYGRRLDEIHGQLDQSINDGKQIVNDHPALVMGMTLAVGVIAGLLLSRKRTA